MTKRSRKSRYAAFAEFDKNKRFELVSRKKGGRDEWLNVLTSARYNEMRETERRLAVWNVVEAETKRHRSNVCPFCKAVYLRCSCWPEPEDSFAELAKTVVRLYPNMFGGWTEKQS